MDFHPSFGIIKLIKNLGEYMWAWLKLPSTVREIEKKITSKPLSSEAKFCPNCDERMKVSDNKRFDVWWYSCEKCNKHFQHPAPTAFV